MVREEGLEPSILAAQDFKSCVYTDSTTLALLKFLCISNYTVLLDNCQRLFLN